MSEVIYKIEIKTTDKLCAGKYQTKTSTRTRIPIVKIDGQGPLSQLI